MEKKKKSLKQLSGKDALSVSNKVVSDYWREGLRVAGKDYLFINSPERTIVLIDYS